MPKKKNRIRLDRLFIFIFIVLTILSLLGFSGYFIVTYIKNHLPNSNEVKKEETEIVLEEKEVITIALNDYNVYIDDTDSLGFNFVIAYVNVSTNLDSLSFSIDNLSTSEKLNLSNLTKYKNKVSAQGYDLSSFEITDIILLSEKSSEDIVLFIPFEKELDTLKVYNQMDTSKFDIDLTQNKKYLTSLKISSGENLQIDDDFNIYVSNSTISTKMSHNEEEYDSPDSLPVYTFVLTVNNVEDDVQIVDAIFIKEGDNEEHHALDSSYSSLKFENIINKELKPGTTAALFFQIASDDSYISYDGVLMIQFSNSDDWVKINTEIR